MTDRITFMTANYVARYTGWALTDWGQGDRTTQEAFGPLDTFPERFDTLLAEIAGLGFDAIDLWSAHLSPDWATDAHVEAALAALARHGISVASYASGVRPETVEPVCELAAALGVGLVTGPVGGELEAIAQVLERHGVTLGLENHPEHEPAEVLAKIERGGPSFGATVDTGWWGTQGYDAAQAIEELGERIVHVHLKDVLAAGAHETCRWGEGVVPIGGCVQALQRIGYAGPLSIEHEPVEGDPSEDVKAMRAELAGWLA